MAELMSNSPLARSPARGVSRRARIAYEGPMPRLVVPIGFVPLSPSMKESISFSSGVTRVQRSSTRRSACAALLRDHAELVLEGERVEGDARADEQLLLLEDPEGRRWKTKVLPPMTIVCPALLPPLYLTTASNLSA